LAVATAACWRFHPAGMGGAAPADAPLAASRICRAGSIGAARAGGGRGRVDELGHDIPRPPGCGGCVAHQEGYWARAPAGRSGTLAVRSPANGIEARAVAPGRDVALARQSQDGAGLARRAHGAIEIDDIARSMGPGRLRGWKWPIESVGMGKPRRTAPRRSRRASASRSGFAFPRGREDRRHAAGRRLVRRRRDRRRLGPGWGVLGQRAPRHPSLMGKPGRGKESGPIRAVGEKGQAFRPHAKRARRSRRSEACRERQEARRQ